MKVYTGTGDQGITSLFSGERVAKSHTRIEANGDVDELNSVLGVLEATLSTELAHLGAEIQRIQSHLLHLGAWLATTPDSPSVELLAEIDAQAALALERAIDRMVEPLPALAGFILPGGRMAAAWAHVARTVCRRAERHVVRLLEESNEGKAGEELRKAVVYLNRLSDYLFVLARYCNWLGHVPDVAWNS